MSVYCKKKEFFFEVNQHIITNQSYTLNYSYIFHKIKIGQLYLIALMETISQKLRFLRIVEKINDVTTD